MMKKVGVGIDIGSRFIKVAKVRRKGTQLVIERLLKIERQTPEETMENLSTKMRTTNFPIGEVVAGISGRGVMLRYTHVPPVPDFRLKMIMEYEMAELAGKNAESISSDYKILNIPREINQDNVALVAITRDEYVSENIDLLASAGIGTRNILPTSLAIYNTFLSLCEFETDKIHLVVDIGATNTDVAIIGEKNLYFARSMGKGADEFTEAISSALGISFAEAEKVKLSEGIIKRKNWTSEREKLISDSLSSTADRLFSIINSTIGFAKTQLKMKNLKADNIFLFGGGAALPGLSEHLSATTGIPVITPDILKHRKESPELQAIDRRLRLGDILSAEDIAQGTPQLSEFACAIGLAISELDPSFISLNLMPKAVRKKREFKQKTVFMYAAAAASVIFLIGRFATALSESFNANSKNETLQQIATDCDNRLSQFKSIKSDNEKVEKALQTAAKLTDPGSFVTNVLFMLRKTEIVPKQVKIEEMSTKQEEVSRKTVIILKGEVVAERGNEFAILREFRENLKNQKLIKDAVIDPSKTLETEGHFFFEITLIPES